ncbi:MAG: SagB/ThcOx family dehydrogenase [Oscillospiraceae bacterium]|jgi:SagB-type dehydrogenase family enzyme|nr:SagB/ThcOx family dehydrogenase [Oscillospiraceae bacterium]
MDEIMRNRIFMKCPDISWDRTESDQAKGLPHPPLAKAQSGEVIELQEFESFGGRAEYSALLDSRRSERLYSDAPITQAELAFLLWSAQGAQKVIGVKGHASLRPAPSGGARHPFELYAAVRNVEGLMPGFYHYLPMEHVGEKKAAIELIRPIEDFPGLISEMLSGQSWAAKAAVVLFFSCVPYRAEWRYDKAAHRVMLIDLGHAGQNVMLSAAALGLGSCCIAAYDAAICDTALGLDGAEEYTVYAISAGVCKRGRS